jgi:hypothetical protein
MSRGLGKLQREILATLPIAQGAVGEYRGGYWKWKGWVTSGGCSLKLADGVYDLRAVLRVLAMARGEMETRGLPYIRTGFRVSFNRAVASLIQRGELEVLKLVPVADWEPENCYGRRRIHHLADGLFFSACSERRFVRVPVSRDP